MFTFSPEPNFKNFPWMYPPEIYILSPMVIWAWQHRGTLSFSIWLHLFSIIENFSDDAKIPFSFRPPKTKISSFKTEAEKWVRDWIIGRSSFQWRKRISKLKNCWQKWWTKIVDKNYWQKLLTKIIDKSCWQKLLTKVVDKSCWQKSLTKIVDKNFWHHENIELTKEQDLRWLFCYQDRDIHRRRRRRIHWCLKLDDLNIGL